VIINNVAKDLLKCQNLEEQFSHLISDLPAVCFKAFGKLDKDEWLILLVYEAHHPHVLQVEASNPAFNFPFKFISDLEQRIRDIMMRIVTLHPEGQKLELTGQHYATVASKVFFMYLRRLCPSADEFHKADNLEKEIHSMGLSALLCITHVLPLACKYDIIFEHIFLSEDSSTVWKRQRNFHAKWTLDGWNDHIIQPARDAVLDYYKVCTANMPST